MKIKMYYLVTMYVEDKVTLANTGLLRSYGNFETVEARSAPSTPSCLLTTPGAVTEPLSQPCSPGYSSPCIQRSPSHSVFSKSDKNPLKHLSTSTPAMTAQELLAEPPSPKSKVVKSRPTSKSHQKKFIRHFPHVEVDEKVKNHYSCALVGDILLQGHLYITDNFFAFYSNVFGYVTKLLIPILSVESITKEKTARIIPNAVGITTGDDKHVFGSLMSRDNTYRFMMDVWHEATRSNPSREPESTGAESETSDTRGESGRESPMPAIPPTLAYARNSDKDNVSSDQPDGSSERKSSTDLIKTIEEVIADFTSLPKQRLIIYATLLLLILLFLSAAVLLYRISKIQNKYSFTSQDNLMLSGNEEIYNDLFQWQTHLHTKSAGAVNNFLDSNLDQIAKVRQSLEALSALLMPNNSPPTQDISSRSVSSKEAS